MMSLHESKAAEGQARTLDSILIWTGDIGGILPSGERYRYADVFAVMKTIWQQGLQLA
jgi:hypothetical protein